MMNKKNEVAKKESSVVEYVPFGANKPIKLSAAIIREFIAVPTRSGAMPNQRDCMKFLMLCRGKRANPFEGDCYLIGYDSQNGPIFSLVTGIELFLKRAEQSPDYDGSEYGVVVTTSEGETIERQGALVYDNEKLQGGWAKVYRKNHSRPIYKSVKLSTYNTGRSRWEKDPGGMISKVALSQALRETYTTALGGLYTQEEMQKVIETGADMFAAQDLEPITMPEEIPDEQPPETDPEQGAQPEAGTSEMISLPQLKRLYAIAKTAGKSDAETLEIVASFGFTAPKEVTKQRYNDVCAKLQAAAKRQPGEDE